MAESGIYEIVNLVNGKRYVGSAVEIQQRWREHRWALRRGNHPNIHLQRAWNKHGEANFDFRALELCEEEQLIKCEQSHIDERAEYNICPTAGSTLGRRHSEETRKKIGAKKVGLKLPPRNAEYRSKISEAMKRRPPNPERVAKMAATKRGSKLRAEHKAKIGEAVRLAYAEGRRSRERPPEYREKIAAGVRRHASVPEVRERLREQARKAWEAKTPEERAARMEKVRAGRRR